MILLATSVTGRGQEARLLRGDVLGGAVVLFQQDGARRRVILSFYVEDHCSLIVIILKIELFQIVMWNSQNNGIVFFRFIDMF